MSTADYDGLSKRLRQIKFRGKTLPPWFVDRVGNDLRTYQSLPARRNQRDRHWLVKRLESFSQDMTIALKEGFPEIKQLKKDVDDLSEHFQFIKPLGSGPSNRDRLRRRVFGSLEALRADGFRFRLTNRRGLAAQIMVAVLAEADRLDGISPRARAEFKLQEWLDWCKPPDVKAVGRMTLPSFQAKGVISVSK